MSKNTGATPNAETDALQALLKSREKLATEFKAAQEALSAVDKQIAARKDEVLKAEQEAALKQIVPGDKSALKGRDIQFLLNSSGPAGKTLLDASIAAAREVHTLVTLSGEKDASVTGRFWGVDGATSPLGMQAHNTTVIPNQGNFLTAAQEILVASMPNNVKGRQKNYIVVSNGAVADDVAQSVVILKAAAELNPKATFDFVVCNKAGTKVEELTQKLKEAGVNRVNLVKVGTPQEIAAAVKNLIKTRLADKASTPVAKTTARPAA